MKLALNPVIFLGICGALLPHGMLARSLPLARDGTPDIPLRIRHISRSERDVPAMPLDMHTKHLPCDMDQRGASSYMFAFPNQCIWSFNNRYMSEGHYRIYRTYQLESFFFGQYHERLKRYEFDPHSFDYN